VEGSPMQNHLFDLLKDKDVEVVRRAALSAGETGSVGFVPTLVEMLGNSNVRVSVRNALAEYGTSVLGTLVPTMTDGRLPMLVRRQIPRLIGMITHQESADALIRNLEYNGADMKYKIIRALEDLRTVPTDIRFDPGILEKYVVGGIRNYYQLTMILTAWNESVSPRNASAMPAPDLLQKVLQERLDRDKEMVFRLLRLIYPPETMYNAYRGVTSSNPRVREDAVELLDNILNHNIKRMLFPIIDEASETLFMVRAAALWNLQPMTEKEAITSLIDGQDNWLKACALHTIGEKRISELQEHIEMALKSSEPLIRESAEFAWRNLS